MKTKPRRRISPLMQTALEFGPTVVFVIAYLVFRDENFVIGWVTVSGLIAVIAVFIPVFLLAIFLLRLLTGRIAPIQIATAVMIVVFGCMSVWFNDPRFFKMKPTAIYIVLALILTVGLLRGQYWLKYLAEEIVPMEPAGWSILTKRLIALFVLSAGANELVWRTQSEAFWVIFETVVMPVVVIAFFVTQIGVFVDYATLNPSKKKR